MSIITKKRLLLTSIITIGLFVWSFTSDGGKDGFVESSVENVTKSNGLISKKDTIKAIEIKGALSPALTKEIAFQKEKLREKRMVQEKFLQARKEYLQKEDKTRSSYLSKRARYTQLSSNQIKRKFDTVKLKRENSYKQSFKQQNAYRGYERQSQTKKRVSLNTAKLNTIRKVQEKQLLNQKYKKGE